MIRTWPELDATAADCTGPDNCFSLSFATAPASPAPKFWEYTYGVPVLAVQKLADKTGREAYFDYVKKYVDRYVDGSGLIDYGKPWPVVTPPTSPSDPTIQDVIQPSTLLFGVYAKTHDPRYLTAMASTRKTFDTIKANGEGAWWHKPTYPNQQWLDAIFMSQPFLVKYGALFADAAAPGDASRCFAMSTQQIKLAAEHTFDPATQLYRHAWNGAADGKWLGLAPPSKTAPLDGVAVSPILWSRSLGWLLAGVVDVLDDLPKTHPDRPALLAIIENIAQGLKRYQDPVSGLWYQVIDVMNGPLPANGGYPTETVAAVGNWLETSSSALFTYGLAKAVRMGYLGADSLDVARRGWQGVKSKVDVAADGKVTIHGTVVGMSVGGTYNAYTNADARSDLSAALPPPAPKETCPATGMAGVSAPVACKYIYVRDNVPQGFGAVLLAATELEY
jgi:unsaturated rhamnogalacturonyl hydrolase